MPYFIIVTLQLACIWWAFLYGNARGFKEGADRVHYIWKQTIEKHIAESKEL